MYSIHAHAVTVRALSCQTLCSYLFFLHFVIMLQLKNVKICHNLELRGRCDLEVKPTFMVRDFFVVGDQQHEDLK